MVQKLSSISDPERRKTIFMDWSSIALLSAQYFELLVHTEDDFLRSQLSEQMVEGFREITGTGTGSPYFNGPKGDA